MVKLTPELITGAYQFLNPLKDRELDLRGYKIPLLENLGATVDQFDVIDFSDNELRKLDGFPLLKRLKCLLLNNNRIVRLATGLGDALPNLQAMVLTNNQLQELSDLEPLGSMKSLEIVSLLHNPVVHKQHYRPYVIHLLPNLRILDFRKVKKTEKEEAAKLFKSKKGKEMKKNIEMRAKTFVPGEEDHVGAAPARKPLGAASAEDVRKIRQAIANAKTLEEVERLNQMLQRGQIPFTDGHKNGEEMETD